MSVFCSLSRCVCCVVRVSSLLTLLVCVDSEKYVVYCHLNVSLAVCYSVVLCASLLLPMKDIMFSHESASLFLIVHKVIARLQIFGFLGRVVCDSRKK